MEPLRPFSSRPGLYIRAARTSVMSFGFAALAALSSSLVAVSAGAQTAPTYVFDTIDSYRVAGSTYYLTGVQHGQTAPTSITLLTPPSADGAASCERAFIQMVNRPGRFTLSLYGAGSSCAITRNP